MNEALVVELPRNPSTGFRWQLIEPPNAVLKADGLPAYASPGDPKKVGSSGLETWTIRPVRSGQQDVRFEYRRPFDKGAKADRVVIYKVTVR